MARFEDRPLHEKLMRAGGWLTSAAMLALLLFVLMYQLSDRREILEDAMNAHAKVVGSNGAASIMFGNESEASEVLASLAAVSDITWAELLDEQGQRMARYERPGLHKTCLLFGLRKGCFLTVRQPIVLRGQIVGSVLVEASLESVYRGLLLQAAFGAAAAILVLAAATIWARRIAQGIVRPLHRLVRLTEKVSADQNFSLRAEVSAQDEVGSLARSFNAMMEKLEWHDARLNAELVQRRQVELQLNRMAYYDNVTELHNRHYFKEKLEVAVSEVVRCGGACAVLFIDLDDFKIVNDTLGHEAGDVLLRQVAACLRATLRSNDIVCRIGGDEFAVILDHSVNERQAGRVASNLVDALSKPFLIDGRQVRIGASVGVALCPDHATDTVTLLRNADTAMYHAKGGGKNNFRVFAPEMENGSLKRFTLEQALRQAIENGQLQLHYQPQVTLADPPRLVGFEALLRWEHPELGSISPYEFIPLAEETGLIHAIGDWVMRTGFRQASAWQTAYPGVRLGINLSGRQLKQMDIVDRILTELHSSALDPCLVDLELTETVLMDDRAATAAKLQALRQAGIRVALGDFGTGYSSLNYLKLYPVDTIKIDRSFVANLPTDEEDATITRAIISIAEGLGLGLVAEGVETPVHAEFLRAAGCRMAQGYLFARPMNAHDATDMVLNAAKAAEDVPVV